MELWIETSAGPWLIELRLRSGWTDMSGRKVDRLMGLGLRSGWRDMSAEKIDWLMRLGLKSRCEVSAGKLSSGTSVNSLIIWSTSFKIF